jgi:hypothetical protein
VIIKCISRIKSVDVYEKISIVLTFKINNMDVCGKHSIDF